ncbi:unnamed protein product [Gongylonema pulchrum]|uniref:MIR domain-containing protein n=1 Tax=Gongylonema pulchrum TaxID=637853 RepID=A0A183DWN9_9BILA|nr:unnamed protein product [Gongylonema pulchrum]
MEVHRWNGAIAAKAIDGDGGDEVLICRGMLLLLLSVLVASAFCVLGTCAASREADEFVTCTSVVKLKNNQDGVRLHSHDVKYGSGSGQQSVTAVQDGDDVNSYWQILADKIARISEGRVY